MRRTQAALPPLFLLFAFITFSCSGDKTDNSTIAEGLQAWVKPEYAVDAAIVGEELQRRNDGQPTRMYADGYTQSYYQQPNAPMLWISRMGIDERADTLIAWLSGSDEIGLGPKVLSADSLRAALQQLRNSDFSRTDCSSQLARLEHMLTRSYLRYACGQRYGFVRPSRLLNRLLVDTPLPGSKGTTYRRINDMRAEEPTDSFVHVALEAVRNHRITPFLQSIQPTDTLYRTMQREYKRAKEQGDTTRQRLARINMERARCRYPHPTKGRYIFVNLAPQQLTAVNGDSILTMRVCCGNASHKTPLLRSAISYVELNPYWVIPQTIVRKEIMPRHVGDSAYYARNRYHAINKETKEVVDPSQLTADEMRSGRYTLRQERGAGNSLGRIIFRFPNNFSVFLHDTNNHAAFSYGNRAVSHGCVRVERPLDLALFFLDDPKPFFVDRIRMAIGLKPLTAQGLGYQAANPDAKPMPSFSYDRPVPLWLDYWTLYPNTKGQLEAYADSYGYDRAIERLIDSY